VNLESLISSFCAAGAFVGLLILAAYIRQESRR
jgi:hypothetical protein